MALSGVQPTHSNPSTDFTSGSEGLGPAGVGGVEWDVLNNEVMREWGQLDDLYTPTDQGGPLSIAGGRAMARGMNMIFSMVHNMQFRMLKSEGLFTQIQSSMSFMSVRIEEAFKKVDSVVSDIDKKNRSVG